MREIKFRVFDKKAKKILNVDTLYIDERMFKPSGGDEYSVYSYDNKYYSDIMQYTGLKDTNGVEIYEGDIIKKEKDIVVIKYSEYHTSFQVYYNVSMASKTSLYEFGYSKELEVIGNIYEHSHLLDNN